MNWSCLRPSLKWGGDERSRTQGTQKRTELRNSELLMESELFGYAPGAFTGASKNGKQGMFELAYKGTIFLDEIVEVPMVLQAKLLRVLQEREIQKVGGVAPQKVDVRIIAATNKNLEKMVENGAVRDDLFYCLNVIPLTIPPPT
ncbi:hypothetical protein SY88_08240 [Clostridiales bacterium PH28_bin88]|nr:hypothetical protein SY88_08240 [Clostridiales bacterium PH28_bin88]